MLAGARAQAGETVHFAAGDIGTWTGSGIDLVFSNAALQWVPDHPGVATLARRPGRGRTARGPGAGHARPSLPLHPAWSRQRADESRRGPGSGGDQRHATRGLRRTAQRPRIRAAARPAPGIRPPPGFGGRCRGVDERHLPHSPPSGAGPRRLRRARRGVPAATVREARRSAALLLRLQADPVLGPVGTIR